MKAIGLIAEYNPFHHGHRYQIQTVKEQLSADVLIVLMSGNVVQRGEFALLDKWTRAELALQAGADLVIELPLNASLQSADYFAQTSIRLLDLIGCQSFVFGTESASTHQLQSYVDWLVSERTLIDQKIQTYLASGYAYPKAMDLAIQAIIPPELQQLDYNQPNHLLGIQYLLANQQLGNPMIPYTLPRRQLPTDWSGSQIRAHWLKIRDQSEGVSDQLQAAVPATTYQALMKQQGACWADYWPYLRYQLLASTPQSLAQLHHVDEGIEYKLIQQAQQSNNFESFIDGLISRRWTRSAVQRVLMSTLLQITQEDWSKDQQLMRDKPTLRVLACNHYGQSYLSQRRTQNEQNSLTLFSNLTQTLAEQYALMLRVDRIYTLNTHHAILDQITGRYPIFLQD